MKSALIPIDGNLVVEFTRTPSGYWEIRKYTLPNRPEKPNFRLPTKVLKAIGILLLGQHLDTTFCSLLWKRSGLRKRDCKVEH